VPRSKRSRSKAANEHVLNTIQSEQKVEAEAGVEGKKKEGKRLEDQCLRFASLRRDFDLIAIEVLSNVGVIVEEGFLVGKIVHIISPGHWQLQVYYPSDRLRANSSTEAKRTICKEQEAERLVSSNFLLQHDLFVEVRSENIFLPSLLLTSGEGSCACSIYNVT
jgi:hypothetical protein